jgi:hypothetical protein
MKQINQFTINRNSVFFTILVILISSINSFSQIGKIEIAGTIIDETQMTIPYAAVGIVKKGIGTSSTEDGEFSLLITKNDLQDSLSISSLGYNVYKIKVQDFLNQKDRKVILKESVIKMDDITLLKPSEYVENAVKNLKANTLSKSHQIELLYRRAATEGGKSKFFVENYIKIKDKGPAYALGRLQVTEIRKSADYRIWKRKQWVHSINYMGSANPFRYSDKKPNLKKYIWKKIGDTSYEGEDVVIISGKNKKGTDPITFYIGLDDYKVFRIERNKALFLYKKHKSGKLHLSYYKNEWGFGKNMIPKQYWNTEAEKMSYRIEAFVLNVETLKSKIKVRDFGSDTDMGSLTLPYNSNFWKSLSMPPDTKFYKKIKSELENMYGVPLETQYELVNK